MILVFGSINVDLILPVPRLPHPGETVLGGDYAILPGGKGANQALAARRAGSQVAMAGAVGADSFAALAVEPLTRAGTDTSLVREVAGPTGLAAIFVAEHGENAIAVASGANRAPRAADVPDAMLGPGTILLAQMEVPPDENAALIRRTRAAGGRSILNLAPALPFDRALLPMIDLLVANEAEAATLGADAAGLAALLGQALIVTRGPDGATAWLAGGGRLAVPALPIEAIDTTGAGDTFLGVLAAGIDQGLLLETALRRASAAAGLACLRQGAQTAIPDRAAIEEAALRLPP